ncbi:MAG: hypothetical protein WC136_01305 [Sphaerochaeta sp.]|jgi:hypothetical protein
MIVKRIKEIPPDLKPKIVRRFAFFPTWVIDKNIKHIYHHQEKYVLIWLEYYYQEYYPDKVSKKLFGKTYTVSKFKADNERRYKD